jgi:hypothetical protein
MQLSGFTVNEAQVPAQKECICMNKYTRIIKVFRQMLHKIGYGHFLANHSLFVFFFYCMALEVAQAQMLIQHHKITKGTPEFTMSLGAAVTIST